MPSTYSDRLNLTLMATGENDNTWGQIANDQVFKLLDAAVSKLEVVTLIASDVNLSVPAGSTGSPDGRAMILDVQGTPSGAYNIIVPTEATGQTGGTFNKVYLVRHNLSNTQPFTVKTSAGTGVTFQDGDVKWVFCDGTDVYQVTQDTVTNASNADNLLSDGGYVTGESFIRKDLGVGTSKVQTFTKGQNAVRYALTWGTNVSVPNGESNSFKLVVSSTITATISNPSISTSDADGQVIRIMIHHQAAGATINWGSAYAWASGQPPTLSGGAGDVDYLAFEYFADYPGGGKWVGAAILDIS